MKRILLWVDEKTEKKAYYNISKEHYNAVIGDLVEKTRIELVKSKKPLFYQFTKKYRKYRKRYSVLLDIRYNLSKG